MKHIISFSAVFIFGCSMPHLKLDPSLQQQGQVMEVSGRQGLMISQKLSFGPYHTEAVDRDWTTSYDIPIVVRFRGAKEKLNFVIHDNAQHRAEVFAAGSIESRELSTSSDLFAIPLDYQDAFVGSVRTGKGNVWNFVVDDPSHQSFSSHSKGELSFGDRRISLSELKELSTHNATMQGVLGYEFRENNKVIGVVELLNDGRVVLSRQSDAQTQLVIASVAAALLLRSDLSKTLEEQDQRPSAF